MSQQNSNHLYLVNSIISAPTDQYKKRQFHMFKLLGKGGEGAVYAAKPRNCQYSKDVALKLQLNMKDLENSFIEDVMDYQKKYDQDPQTCSGIISILEKFQFQNCHALLMELGGLNLYDYIKTNQNLSIQERFKICIDLFRPIYFIHQKSKFHRDIKPENFILVGNQFKLIDFGLIKDAGQDFNRTKGIGSLYYQAPELAEQRTDYNEKVDCWALACVFYEVLSGETLIKSESVSGIRQEILQFQFKKEQYFQRIDKIQIPQDCKAALKKMLEPNPNHRLSFIDALTSFLEYEEFSEPNYQNVQPPTMQYQNQQVYQTQSNPVQQTQYQMYQQQQNFQPKVQQQLQYNIIQPQQQQLKQQPPLLQQQPLQLQQQPTLLQQVPQTNIQIEGCAQQIINEIVKQYQQQEKQEIKNQNYESKVEIVFQNAEKEILDVGNQIIKDIENEIIKKKNQEIEDLKAKIQEQEKEIILRVNNYTTLLYEINILQQKNDDLEQQVQKYQRQNQNYQQEESQQENQNQNHEQLSNPNQQQRDSIESQENQY